MDRIALTLTMALLALASAAWADVPGLKGDGKADDGPAIQAALDEAGARGGGVVALPAGQYRVNGALVVPSGVTLAGVWETPHFSTPAQGTTLLAYGGRGQADGPALILLKDNSAVRGLTIYYPEQTAADVQPYPPAIAGAGTHLNVSEVTLLNPYVGIDFSRGHEMHYIRNVYGCPLRVGVRVDRCTDIGRIENVHFNPNSWGRAALPRPLTGAEIQAYVNYLRANCVAFEFGRSDWEYVFNTFSWGCKVGYRFFKSDAGATNGNFLGIGADMATYPLLVEETQRPGLLITNGEFVGAPEGEAALEVAASHTGVVQLSNCSFWGPHRRIARVAGKGVVSLAQCNFCDWDDKNLPAIEANGGDLTVQACTFWRDGRQIVLGSDLRTAVILGNTMAGPIRIDNQSKGDVQIGFNASREKAAP